jgi:DNA repair protein RadC
MTEESKLFTIKNWAEDDRPREKLLLKGRQALSDAELIAILIATGTREETAVDVAKRVLALTQNNLNALGRLSVNDLKQVKGIGEAKAISIVAAMELGRRRKEEAPPQSSIINSSKSLFDLMQSYFFDLYHEEFWIVLLNRANKPIAQKCISGGGLDSTVVDVRIIMKLALEHLAVGIVLCHNHPSGKLVPSDADISITKQIKDAAKLLNIVLLDHLIFHQNDYMSFADQKLL